MQSNPNEVSPHIHKDNYYLKRNKISTVGWDIEKVEPLITVNGIIKWWGAGAVA